LRVLNLFHCPVFSRSVAHLPDAQMEKLYLGEGFYRPVHDLPATLEIFYVKNTRPIPFPMTFPLGLRELYIMGGYADDPMQLPTTLEHLALGPPTGPVGQRTYTLDARRWPNLRSLSTDCLMQLTHVSRTGPLERIHFGTGGGNVEFE
jgi:hypothetical protein